MLYLEYIHRASKELMTECSNVTEYKLNTVIHDNYEDTF